LNRELVAARDQVNRRAVENDPGDRQEQDRDAVVNERLDVVDDDEWPVGAL
jgi:hypothetical protein